MRFYFFLILIGLLYASCGEDIPPRQLLRGIVINACDSSVFENVQLQLSRQYAGVTSQASPPLIVGTVVSDENGYFEFEYPFIKSSLYSLETLAPDTKFGYIGDGRWVSGDAAPLIEKTIILRERAQIDFQFSNINYDSLVINFGYDRNFQLENSFTLFKGQDSMRVDTLSCGILNIQALGLVDGKIDSFHSEQMNILPSENVTYKLHM